MSKIVCVLSVLLLVSSESENKEESLSLPGKSMIILLYNFEVYPALTLMVDIFCGGQISFKGDACTVYFWPLGCHFVPLSIYRRFP